MTSMMTEVQNNQPNIFNVDAWIPAYQFQNPAITTVEKNGEVQIVEEKRYIRENAPYAQYTYQALIKRSTKRLTAMYIKVFGQKEENVTRYQMIDALYEELYKYHASFDKLMGVHPETGRFYVCGFVKTENGEWHNATHAQSLNTRFDPRGRKNTFPAQLKEIIISIHENDEELRGKYTMIAKQLEDVAQEHFGVTLYQQMVRAILTKVQ